jgi:hypothetical protein
MRERLGNKVSGVAFTSYLATLHIPVGVDEVVDFWRTYYGPTVRAFDAVSNHPERERALTAEFRSHFARFNRGGSGKTVVDAEYLEVRGIRR